MSFNPSPSQAADDPRHPLVRLLSRTTSSGNFIPEIDGLRFLAIFSVIAFHLVEYMQSKMASGAYPAMPYDGPTLLVHQGYIGVELFFMISGFVVAMPFAKHYLCGAPRMSLRFYYLRRLTRLEPPYLIALAFWFTFFAITGLGPGSIPKMLRHLPAAITYTHMAIYHVPNIIYQPAWSLEMEAQFYLIAPLLVLVFAIRINWLRRVALVTAMLTVAIGQRWLRPAWQAHGDNVFENLHYFLAGFVLLELYLTVWSEPSRWKWVWDIATLVGFALVPIVLLKRIEDNVTVPLLFLLACAGVVRGSVWRAVARAPMVYLAGGMCYTIYLYHFFFIGAGAFLTLRFHIGEHLWLNFLIQLLLLLPLTIAGSAVLFVLTEKPFMRRDWPARVWAWMTGSPGGMGVSPTQGQT
jgi:peptidoglycan/LPS O-acetylase OafA/YrhL